MVWEFLAGAVFAKMFLGGRTPREEQVRAGFSIKPNTHWVFRRELETAARVRCLVKSSRPVDVHFLRHAELAAFRANEAFSALSTKENVVSFEDDFVAPPGTYVILIVNWDKSQVASGLYDVTIGPT